MGLLKYKWQWNVDCMEKAEVLRAFFSPCSLQTEPPPWPLQVSEQFGKEPALGEQVRNYFTWTCSYLWDWAKVLKKLAALIALLAAVYCLWKIVMNGKSEHYSHIQGWQKWGSGTLSVAGSPQFLQKTMCVIFSWNPFLNSNRTSR